MNGLNNEYKQMLKATDLFYKVYPNGVYGGMNWLKESYEIGLLVGYDNGMKNAIKN
jgi:hypothetical protein